jgi:hypothetical protein
MDKEAFKTIIEGLANRTIFNLSDLVNQSDQTAEYNLSPKGEGKRFWTQVVGGEFNTSNYEIRPVSVKKGTPQKYQKWVLDEPIIAPNSDVTVRFANELLKPLGKTLAIVPLKYKADIVA